MTDQSKPVAPQVSKLSTPTPQADAEKVADELVKSHGLYNPLYNTDAAGVLTTKGHIVPALKEAYFRGLLARANSDAQPAMPNSADNTTTLDLRGSEEQSETGRVKLSGVQDHADKAQVVGGGKHSDKLVRHGWTHAGNGFWKDPVGGKLWQNKAARNILNSRIHNGSAPLAIDRTPEPEHKCDLPVTGRIGNKFTCPECGEIHELDRITEEGPYWAIDRTPEKCPICGGTGTWKAGANTASDIGGVYELCPHPWHFDRTDAGEPDKSQSEYWQRHCIVIEKEYLGHIAELEAEIKRLEDLLVAAGFEIEHTHEGCPNARCWRCDVKAALASPKPKEEK